MPPTEYTREYFREWTRSCGVHAVQKRYDQIWKDAKESGRTIEEEVKASKDRGDFVESRFRLTCRPSQFGELGSGFVLYFHLLTMMMVLFVVLFLLQVYPIVRYAGVDYLSGWQWNNWVEAYSADSSKACGCVGRNNGMTGPLGSAGYGTSCAAWDAGLCSNASCPFSSPGRWTCQRWCFAAPGCPAPVLDGEDASMSNRNQAPDLSVSPSSDQYQGLVRSYSACAQDAGELAGCTAGVTSPNVPYSESDVDPGDVDYATQHAWLTPGNYGPDQAEDSTILLIYLVCLGVVCACVFFAYQYMVVVDLQLDADLVSPNDFAVMFSGLPVTATNEKSLLEWFKKHAVRGKEDTEIVKVVIGWDPGKYTDMIKELKSLKKQLDHVEGRAGCGLCSCFQSTESAGEAEAAEAERIKARMVDINKALASADSSKEMVSSGVVVVVFRFQEDMRACLSRWSSTWRWLLYCDGLDSCLLPAGNGVWPGPKLEKFPIGETPLNMVSAVRAPNPGDIHWEELGVASEKKYKKLAKTNGCMLILVLVCFFVTWGFNKAQDVLRDSGASDGVGFSLLTVLPGLGITFTNILISLGALRWGQEEYHDTWTSENFSQMLKMTVGMLVNTGFVMFFVNARPSEWYKMGGLVEDASTFLMFSSWIPAVIPLVDIGWRMKSFKRKRLTDAKLEEWNQVVRQGPPKSKEQAEAYRSVVREVETFKLAFSPSELRYTRRFAIALKTFIACLLYMPLCPFVSLIGFVGIFLQYWVDKYVLLKWAKRPTRPMGCELPLHSLKLMKYSVPVLFSLTTFMFLTPSFEDKTSAYNNFIVMIVFSACFSLLLPISAWVKPFARCFVNAEHVSDMDYFQAQHTWTKEMKYHKDQFVYKRLPEAVNPEMLSPAMETVPVTVDAIKASYGAAVTAMGREAAASFEPPRLKGGAVAAKPGLAGSKSGALATDADLEAAADLEGAAAPEGADADAGSLGASTAAGGSAASSDLGSVEEAPAAPGPDAPAGKGGGKGRGKGKAGGGGVVWEFKHRGHFTPFNNDCQKFIEDRYQAFKYAGGRDRIDTVRSGAVTFAVKFSEPMQSKVTSSEGKPWVDARRSVR